MINLKNTTTLSFAATIALLLSGCVVGDTSGGKSEEQTDSGSGQPSVDAMPGAPDSTPTPTADARPPLDEMLLLTFTTEPAGGEYFPRSVLAAWIEDAQGDFVHTLLRRGEEEVQHLNAWNDASGGDETDAVTGATRPDHDDPISLTWDLPDGMADGVYTIRMETADSNNQNENNQGTFTFDKNGTADVQTGLSNGGHSNVSIDYSGR